jgi:hypothetical protein
MNYSLRFLLIGMAGFAVVCASMVYPEPLVGDLFYTFGLLAIAFAAIAAIYFRGSRRAFWVGFLILFAGYYSHSVWPGEIRSTFALFQGSAGMNFPAQGLVTTRLLSGAYESLHPDNRSGQPTSGRINRYGGSPFPVTDNRAGKFIAFMTAGHTAIAFLLGIGGGLIAQRIAALAPPTAKRQLEKILGRDIDLQ